MADSAIVAPISAPVLPPSEPDRPFPTSAERSASETLWHLAPDPPCTESKTNDAGACNMRPAIFAVALILSGCSSFGCTGLEGWLGSDADKARCGDSALMFPVYSVPTWIPGER
jgi:hypothetical protein